MKSLYKFLIKNECSPKIAQNIEETYNEFGIDGIMDEFNFTATELVIQWANKAGDTEHIIDKFLDDIDEALDEEPEEKTNEDRLKSALAEIRRMKREVRANKKGKERDKMLSELNDLEKKTKKLLGRKQK